MNYTSVHADASYWDSLYGENTPAPGFNQSWQGIGYEQLRTAGALAKLEATSRVLLIGCGDSSLPEDLFDAGSQDITCADFSQVLIDALSARNKEARKDLKYIKEDATP